MHPNRGSIFESFIVAEMLKNRLNKGVIPELFFWRDNVGTEIDVVYEEGLAIRSVEIKSGKTFTTDFTSGLEKWMRYSAEKPESCSIVYAGDMEMKIKGIEVRKWDSIL